MSNSKLYNNTYDVPSDIINYIRGVLVSYPTGEGVKRAKHIIKNGSLTYSAMKRLKNFFDYFDSSNEKSQYELAGGDLMKGFIETTLSSDRSAVKSEKRMKSMVGGDARKDVQLTTKAYKTPRLNESIVNKNSICIIVNKNNEFLLVKRSNHKDQWMPNKWALVGGSVNEDESPERACVREIKEEVGLDITKLLKRFVIQRSVDSIEYVFVTRYNGNPTDVKLNPEHNEYGWFEYDEIYEMDDKVPNLVEYLSMSFKKYE